MRSLLETTGDEESESSLTSTASAPVLSRSSGFPLRVGEKLIIGATVATGLHLRPNQNGDLPCYITILRQLFCAPWAREEASENCRVQRFTSSTVSASSISSSLPARSVRGSLLTGAGPSSSSESLRGMNSELVNLKG